MRAFCLLILLCTAVVRGQVEVEGTFRRSTFEELLASYPLEDYVVLPPIDNEYLREQAEAEDFVSHPHPRWFAHAVHIPSLNMQTKGRWSVVECNGRLVRKWHMAIASPGAVTLSLLFNDFYLPRGSEFYVIGQGRTAGAFTGPINNKEDHHFAVAPINGDVVFLEYITSVPEDLEASTDDYRLEPHIEVWKVVHGFRSIYQFFPAQDGFHTKKSIREQLRIIEK